MKGFWCEFRKDWDIVLIIVIGCLLAFMVSASTTVTPGVWDLYRGTAKVASYASQDLCVAAADALGIARTYTCRTRTTVVVAVTPPPPPPPPPPTPPPQPPPVTGAAVFTDLASAPAGALVTTYYPNGSHTTATAEVSGVPIRAGRIREVTPATFEATLSSSLPGDVIYLHGGAYSGRYGTTTWGDRAVVLGSWASNIAIVGYPGEVATIGSFNLTDGGGLANNLTIAGLTLSGWDCVYGGGYWANEESGATGLRFVGNTCKGNYGSSNTMTGLIAVQGDGARILGNDFSNNAPAPINNNHAIYIQVGSDDVEVAWNKFHDLRLGHVVQVHTDGVARKYENIVIHNNELTGITTDAMRGFSVSNVSADSTVLVYNNVLTHLGQSFSAFVCYNGVVRFYHNTVSDILTGGYPSVRSQEGNCQLDARDNIVIATPAIGTLNGRAPTQSSNLTTGDILQRVPGVDVGITQDHAGKTRATPPMIGAYE